MKIAELRRAYRAKPFRRFWLHLADGREIAVTHPENMSVGTDGRCIAVYIPREGFEIIDVPLLTAIDFRRKQSRA